MDGLKIADMCKQDTGGQSYKLARAITQFTPHHSRSFRLRGDYLNFPVDIQFGRHNKQFVREYLLSVDVVHAHGLHQWCHGWGIINPKAKRIIHQHGRLGTLKQQQVAMDRKCKALRCVSTLNLLGYVGENQDRWIPAPMDLAMFDSLKNRLYKRPEEREELFVAHSPTSRGYKGTDDIIQAVETLKHEGLKVRLVLIEKKPYKDCLKMRASCDITYDQMHLCYGNSALEGMVLNQATIVGMPESVRGRVNRIVGYEPFIFAMPDTLVDVLRDVLMNSEQREEAAQRGRRYIEEWHEQSKVSLRVAALYESLF